jgi:aminoglycoside phosphotransferase (APT) family kinase protein
VIDATGERIRWADLPAHVRDAVEGILGGEVVSAESQPGGFSPGTADRVVTASGRRAFVKAVSPAQNPVSPGMHRKEAWITAALPPGTPAPKLLGSYDSNSRSVAERGDDGDWIALVLADVEGRHPATPWTRPELDAVMSTLATMADLLTPAPIAGLPPAVENLGGDFGGWVRVADDPPADLDSWTLDRLPEFIRRAERARDAVSGDTVVHLDVRADNLLIGPSGEVTVVDWPHACRGARWLDRVLLLINVRLYGGHDCEALLRTIDGDLDDMRSVLIGIAGYFVDNARRPPPPGIPTVRAFQKVQGDALLGWIAEW